MYKFIVVYLSWSIIQSFFMALLPILSLHAMNATIAHGLITADMGIWKLSILLD